ncbi:hypothetical protein GH721_03525 [Kriegella sp. EG-1]|nr:hypothetical protein [Flavobacteriaceae bacterium EG-1]
MNKTSINSFWITIILLSFLNTNQAQESGPVIMDYGKVWKLDQLEFKTNTNLNFKALFDVSYSPKNKQELNGSINTAARFLNMHAQDGVPVSQLKVALVIHGNASDDLLISKAYKAKHGVDNPNEKLIKDLIDAGVKIVFCGQTFVSKGFSKADLIKGVQLSLSAMTALVQFQEEDYKKVF